MEFLSRYEWSHGGVQYEVNSFHHAEHDAWCYELYAVNDDPDRNDYVEVRIPDATPGGPFTPAPADRVLFLAHGEPRIAWPILRQFLDLIHEAGDIVIE